MLFLKEAGGCLKIFQLSCGLLILLLLQNGNCEPPDSTIVEAETTTIIHERTTEEAMSMSSASTSQSFDDGSNPTLEPPTENQPSSNGVFDKLAEKLTERLLSYAENGLINLINCGFPLGCPKKHKLARDGSVSEQRQHDTASSSSSSSSTSESTSSETAHHPLVIVPDWLAKLIGVHEGTTLGEFIRDYHVHVLYDLVWTFFRFIFFVYAGWLIP